jgi:predicted  nucleic acid-binding Zn ribbon protein
MKEAARQAKVRAATLGEKETAMALRDKLVVVADDFKDKAAAAAERKSWIEAYTYRAASNEVRKALGLPEITDWNGHG